MDPRRSAVPLTGRARRAQALLAWAACACACAAVAPWPAAAAGQTVSLNQGGQAVRIAVGEAAVLPADFPADVALPEHHAVVRVERTGTATTVEVEAPGNVDDEAARFRERMTSAGWTAARIRAPATAPGQAQAWEKDQRAVVAWVSPAPAGVRLQVELLPRR
jgi:hypothetical protein